MPYSDQKKGTLLAFTAIMFITPDSLFIILSNLTSWNLIFYRGFIPFLVVFVGLLIVYKTKFISQLIENGWHGIAYASVFTVTNIFFVISIENTNVANTLIMIALAPMLSAVISFIFLKENTDKKTWIAIIITTLAVIYIFYDALDAGDFLGNFLGLVAAMGLAVGANIIRSAKKIRLVPSAIDEFPLLFILASVTKGITKFSGINELRHKESDRIKSITTGLNQIGIKTKSTINSLKIYGNPNIQMNKTVKIFSKKDHRIAMSFFCLGQLLNGNIEIKNFETVNTSFSKFLVTMKKIGAKYEIKK